MAFINVGGSSTSFRGGGGRQLLCKKGDTQLRLLTTTMTMSTSNHANRRQFLTQAIGMLIGSAASLSLVKEASAGSLNDLAVADSLAVVELGKAKAEALKQDVSKWKAVCSDEDKLLVLRYVPIWFTPSQVACEKIVKLTTGNKKVDSDKVLQQALLLKGHLVELNMEAKNLSSAGIIRELDEFIETADIIIDIVKPVVA